MRFPVKCSVIVMVMAGSLPQSLVELPPTWLLTQQELQDLNLRQEAKPIDKRDGAPAREWQPLPWPLGDVRMFST
jgi:hypothetical protein